MYDDVRLSCTTRRAIVVDVHPIRDGDNGMAVIGSSLVVYTRSAQKMNIVLAAVLKHREQASVASRIYYAPRYCRRA